MKRDDGKTEARSRLEIGLVVLFSLGVLAAYAMVFWPWTPRGQGKPLQVFVALPVLLAAAWGALCLGSEAIVRFWQDQVDRRPLMAWIYPAAIAALYAAGTLVAGYFRPLDATLLAICLAVPVAFARIGRVWADWAMCLAAWLPIQTKLLSLPTMPFPRLPDLWNNWVRRLIVAPEVPAGFDEAQRELVKALYDLPRWEGPVPNVSVEPLFMACVGFWAILVVRRLDGFDFRLTFSLADLLLGAKLFVVYAVFALPVALISGFAKWEMAFTLHQTKNANPYLLYPLLPVGMFFGVALVEEALFRGLLQNLIAKATRNRWIGLAAASLAFGLVHYKLSMPWMYVFFATAAGAVYGWAYIKTGRITTGAITHALVNTAWLILFNPTVW